MKTFLLSFLFVAGVLPLSAQIDSTGVTTLQSTETLRLTVARTYALGLQVGASTGTGVAFRYYPGQRVALEAIASYITLSRPFASLGAEVQYELSSGADRVYALLGIGYFYYQDSTDINSYTAPTRLGIGVGYDLFVSNSISFSFELPITLMNSSNSKLTVLPLPQLEFMYYFN